MPPSMEFYQHFSSAAYKQEQDDLTADVKRGPWTVEEDTLLMNYITIHGEGRWNSTARLAGLKRTGKSCRLRWLNYLRPDLRRGNMTPQEQLLILELHSRWGNKWSKIAQYLLGRTDNEIKNYWRTRVQKEAKLLNCDVNSKQFQDALRYVWIPHLREQIQSSSSMANQKYDQVGQMRQHGFDVLDSSSFMPEVSPSNSGNSSITHINLITNPIYDQAVQIPQPRYDNVLDSSSFLPGMLSASPSDNSSLTNVNLVSDLSEGYNYQWSETLLGNGGLCLGTKSFAEYSGSVSKIQEYEGDNTWLGGAGDGGDNFVMKMDDWRNEENLIFLQEYLSD